MSVIKESHLNKLLETINKKNLYTNIDLVLSFSPTGKIGVIDRKYASLVFNDPSFNDKSSHWRIEPTSINNLAITLIDLL